MRIALLDSWSRDPAVGSGSASAIAGLAGALETLGHRVIRPSPPFPRPGPAGRTPSEFRRLAYNLSLPFVLRSDSFDLVVGVDVDGVFVRRATDAPYVVSLKGVAADEARFERGLPRRRLLALAALEGRNARRAERVVVTSRHCRDVAVDRYKLSPGRMRIVPEGVDVGYWARDAGESRAERGESPTILTVARQYPRKNTRALLGALPAVSRAVPDVGLRVVGGGPELPALRRLARDLGLDERVEFLGAVPRREDVRREYHRADVFCLPSLQEGFGIAFLEAMAAGLPVVALRAAAVPEVVPHGEAGVLVHPERPAELAEALILLLRQPERRARMGRAGRKRARAFEWRAVAGRFLEAALGP